MEGSKENSPVQANFNDLPNELLWKIFHHFGHSDLLQMTLVCRRWNLIIFHFLNDRFRFHPFRCEGLDEHRTYRHLDLSVCPLPLPTHNDKWRDYFFKDKTQLERQNADVVRSIAFKGKHFHLDLILRLLVNFKHIDTMDWDVSGNVRSYYKVTAGIQRKINGSMARIKHLKIKAENLALKHLLQYQSQNLINLDVVLSPYALHNFCRNKIPIPYLETLKLEVDRPEKLNLDGTLTRLLETLPKLRKFSFAMYDPSAIWEVTHANTNIEEFELLNLGDYYIPDMSEMKNLKIFRTDLQMLHFVHFERMQPMPQVTTLDIDQATFVNFESLVENFPNLTTLHMASLFKTHLYLSTLVAAYPALQVLSIRIADAFVEMLELISVGFTNLIELRVNLLTPKDLKNTREDIFSLFVGILAMPTLQKLYITTDVYHLNETIKSIGLPQKCLNCRVFVNGVLI